MMMYWFFFVFYVWSKLCLLCKNLGMNTCSANRRSTSRRGMNWNCFIFVDVWCNIVYLVSFVFVVLNMVLMLFSVVNIFVVVVFIMFSSFNDVSIVGVAIFFVTNNVVFLIVVVLLIFIVCVYDYFFFVCFLFFDLFLLFNVVARRIRFVASFFVFANVFYDSFVCVVCVFNFVFVFVLYVLFVISVFVVNFMFMCFMFFFLLLDSSYVVMRFARRVFVVVSSARWMCVFVFCCCLCV